MENFSPLFEDFWSELNKHALNLPLHWNIDHTCYRVETLERYEELKKQFLDFSVFLGEAEVNGRPICTFKLNQPFVADGRYIDLIELPSPKPGSKYKEGFEHIEVVCDMAFAEVEQMYSQFEFKKGGLGKDYNAELAMKVGDLGVKFHHSSLESVVTLENNEKVFSALMDSGVMRDLKSLSPVVVGTFPLGVHTTESDIDILLETGDFDSLLAMMNSKYGEFDSFESYKVDTYAVCRFAFNDVPFEFYAASEKTVRQKAFLHYLLEERLLKLGGPVYRQKVIELREQGLKTEPAFAAALNLDGDPYEKLLDLQKMSDEKLVEMF